MSEKVIQIDSKPGNFFDDLEALRIDQNFAELVGGRKDYYPDPDSETWQTGMGAGPPRRGIPHANGVVRRRT